MVFEHIEKLKQDFTDKYVVVDATRPELTRFRNAIGLIKTVNMSGRALVEFDQWDNVGWYDIELDFLKVVPKPDPLAEAKKEPAGKAATKPATTKPTAPAASAAQVAEAKAGAKPAVAKPAAGGAKVSTADILAAARAKAGGAVTKPAAAPAEPAKKTSTANILAMARGKAAAAANPVAKKPEPKAPEPEEEVAEAAVPEAAPISKPASKGAAGPLPKAVPDILAYCRKADTK